MGNHADKKYFAEKFNKERKARLEKEEALRIDRLENPEKYRTKKVSRKATVLLSAALGMDDSILYTNKHR